ncbi:hypothetical protein hrd7_18320 [Leptolinea sp. HRD-7]|nr:hypothetical protein hrd7_18320 [Leptolinea sp. HRD-7]
MQLEVLIVTPSGPFGELIRLTLEADPEFHCAMLDNSGDLRATLQVKPCQAVIYDCSFPQPTPPQVVTTLHEEFPETAILLIPTDNRSEKSIPADGWVTRPFDASSLADAVRNAINKRLHPEAIKLISREPQQKPASWWNAFQSGIRETTADSGLMIQNGLVIASTPNLSSALQQQVTASVLRFWNPEDSSDLMRYVKDLVNGQEWMMYATRAADGAVLVLLYLPQTPVTRVRAQTLKLAKDVAGLMVKPKEIHPSNLPENAEPPRLHEILEEKSGTGHVIKNGFPVEWFREADLPDFQSGQSLAEEAAPETGSSQSGDTEPDTIVPVETETTREEFHSVEEIEQEAISEEPAAEMASNDVSTEDNSPDHVTAAEEFNPTNLPPIEALTEPDLLPEENPPSEISSTQSTAEVDLGKFQAVDLSSEIKPESGLDELQPIPLTEIQPESIIKEQFEALAEPDPLSTVTAPGEEHTPEPSNMVLDENESASVSRDEVEEALSILSNRLNMENQADTVSSDSSLEVQIPDAQKILSETDSTGIDVESFQAELSKLEFNDTWSMPEILTGSPQEPLNITTSESEEMAAYLAGIDAQTPKLNAIDSSLENAIAEETPQAVENESLPAEMPILNPVVEPSENSVFRSNAENVSAEDSNSSAITSQSAQLEEITGNIPLSENPPSSTEIETTSESSPDDLFTRMSQIETQTESDGLTTYTIALIPGSVDHFLQRQNAAILSETMNRLALAFNWTLENLTIRPTYMQWTLTMPSNLPVEDMIRIVRKETTVDLKKANPDDLASVGDDYWYPQTMSAAGRDFVPSIHWQDFILRRKTREVA